MGLDGERQAGRALERAGLILLERGFRTRYGEIDWIALDGEHVVFIEVKTRRGAGYGRPAEAVGPRKQRRISRVALVYLQRRGWLERPCRFDVVEVLAPPGASPRVRHVVDAFRLWPTG